MLKQKIQEDTTELMKSKDNFAVGVLRMASASIISKEKEKRYKVSKDDSDMKEEELLQASALSDEEIITVLSSEVKKRRDAITLYEQGNRPELAEQEKKEITILQKYLPEQLSGEELKKIVEESVKKVAAQSMKDMGKIMADLAPKVKGKAGNSEISKIVKELLGN